MHVQFSLLMTVISLSCKGVTAWRYWKERSVWANSGLTRACGHSCRHSSRGHPGLTMAPSNHITEHCAHKLTCGDGLFMLNQPIQLLLIHVTASCPMFYFNAHTLSINYTHITHLFMYYFYFPSI